MAVRPISRAEAGSQVATQSGDAGGRQADRSGCFSVLAGWLVFIAEVVIAAGCAAVMFAALKTNGQVFTEALEATRIQTWEAASALAIAAAGGASAYFLARLFRAPSQEHVLLLLMQLAWLLLTIRLVIWFHGAVPVPAGIHSRGIPSY